MSKILIIDDQRTFRDVFEETLRFSGHEVSATEGGGAGLSLFKKMRPDLVILDRSLPQPSRVDILRSIRKLDNAVKVIVLTAFTTQAKRKYDKLGVSAYLSKGSNLDGMLEAVKEALGS
ncbi:MAG: response regulator [Elusimicrobia bacterium]|nr:response regulator [Elusimicrobiota bacterium]